MKPTVFGILNVTRDSFSDGGRYFSTDAAVAHAKALVADGADVVDVGAASSHPDAELVSSEEEVRRLAPVLDALAQEKIKVSVDSDQPDVQRFAIDRGVAYLNDIHGFSEPALYPQLADVDTRLIVMHSVQSSGHATRVDTPASKIVDAVVRFFESRIAALEGSGVSSERLILDPGMGFFLGRDPACSVEVLRAIPTLKARFALPVLISVSRKSFLQTLTRRDAKSVDAGTAAAEHFAVRQGANAIRTHAPANLLDTLAIFDALTAEPIASLDATTRSPK